MARAKSPASETATAVVEDGVRTATETSDGNTFLIDAKQFDPNRDDVTVHVGDVEEWTILNATTERHVFHIHQLDFKVLQLNDGDTDARGLRDVIDLPYARKGRPGVGQVKRRNEPKADAQQVRRCVQDMRVMLQVAALLNYTGAGTASQQTRPPPAPREPHIDEGVGRLQWVVPLAGLTGL